MPPGELWFQASGSYPQSYEIIGQDSRTAHGDGATPESISVCIQKESEYKECLFKYTWF